MKSLLLTIIAFSTISLFAQNQDHNDSILHLKEVVISSSKVPRLLENTAEVIRIIDAKEIAKLNAGSMAEVLNHITGIHIEGGTGSGLPNRSIINMNGFPANYNLVLIDGVRLLSDHIHTGQNLELIPVECIERIEIIRGASSSQYGSDAMGGIINIITKNGSSQTQYGINISQASYNTTNGGVSILTSVNQNVKTSIFANWEQSDGVEIIAPTNRIGQMGYRQLSIMSKTETQISKKLSAFLNVMYVSHRMDFSNDKKYASLFIPTIGANCTFSDKLLLHTQVSMSLWEAEQSKEFNKLMQPEMFLYYTGIKHNTIQIGTDYKYNFFCRSNVLSKEQISTGIYIQDEYELLKQLVIMGAIRMDKVDDLAEVFSPKIAFLYKPNSKINWRISASRGFHAPTVQEKFEEAYGHSGRALRFGNPDLKPEYSTTYNTGFEFLVNKYFSTYINAFYSSIDNMIVPVYKGAWDLDPSKDVWMRENIHHANIWGYDGFVQFKWVEILKLETGFSFSDNINNSTQRQLPYSPGSAFIAKVQFSQKITTNIIMESFVNYRFVQGRRAWNWKPASGESADNMDGMITKLIDYQKLDAGISIKFDNKYSIFGSLYNILGEEIETLDDAFTVFTGKPLFRVGFKMFL